MLMAHAGSVDGTSVVRYASTTLESAALLGMICLMCREWSQGKGIGDLYEDHLATLVSD